jgi:glycosyltransferase involved in cell wall biosynthesis
MTRFHPLVATAWGSDVLFAGKSWIKRPFVKYVLKRADLITCDADHMIAAMGALGIGTTKMRLIRFGIDTTRFCPTERDQTLKERLGVVDSPAIISLRTFLPVYDVETLIKAVPYVLKEDANAMFILVGTGPQDRMLKDLAAGLGVSENILFFGRIDNNEVPSILASMDIYVSTALSDAGIAASTAEAMACGLPVVITDSGENRNWVDEGKGGFIVPVKSPQLLSEKILYLIKNPDDRSRYGAVNRRTIIEKNDYYKEMAKMEEIYRDVLVAH